MQINQIKLQNKIKVTCFNYLQIQLIRLMPIQGWLLEPKSQRPVRHGVCVPKPMPRCVKNWFCTALQTYSVAGFDLTDMAHDKYKPTPHHYKILKQTSHTPFNQPSSSLHLINHNAHTTTKPILSLTRKHTLHALTPHKNNVLISLWHFRAIEQVLLVGEMAPAVTGPPVTLLLTPDHEEEFPTCYVSHNATFVLEP